MIGSGHNAQRGSVAPTHSIQRWTDGCRRWDVQSGNILADLDLLPCSIEPSAYRMILRPLLL